MAFVVVLLTISVAVFLTSVEALDGHEITSITNQNCSRYLSMPSIGNQSGNAHLMCPPWYHVEANDSSRCQNGLLLHYVVYVMDGTHQPWVQTFYCVTTSPSETSPIKRDVLGSCLYSFGIQTQTLTTYYPLPCNISELNHYMCADLNREGQLCGRCVRGFAPPVFSYSLACVNCTNYHLNWLKYVGVAFGPLTLFCILIILFHIRATSPYLHGIVFYSQVITAPFSARLIFNTQGYKEGSTATKHWEALYFSLFSFWNLDIFRALYDPFCLHPDMTILQALALDYLIAIYPLVLLLVGVGLVSLHSRGNILVTSICRPFSMVVRPCIRNFNIQAELTKSFATLFYLSALKIQSVSLDLLSPTPLYYTDGSLSDKLYLLYAGDIQYFGREHFLFGSAALLMLLVFMLLPALLLFFYPCTFFQQFLNRINCNSTKLRIMVDVFQGNYKDGTGNTRDYRFFSGIFFIARFAIVANAVMFNSLFFFVLLGVTAALLGFSIALFHPQSTRIHYALDSIVFIIFSLIIFVIIGSYMGIASRIVWHISSFLNTVVAILPVLYIFTLSCYYIVVRKRVPQCFFSYLKKKAQISRCFSRSSDYQPLLVCTD